MSGYAEIRFLIPGMGKNRPRAKQRQMNVKRLRARDGDNCWICGHEIDFSLPEEHDESASVDHYVPFSRGGSNHINNLRLAHRCCDERRKNPDIKGGGIRRGKRPGKRKKR